MGTHPFTYLAGLLIGYGLIHAMPVVRRTKAQLHAQPALARQYALFGFALDFVYCGGMALAIVVLGKVLLFGVLQGNEVGETFGGIAASI